jgi:uncharacterized protein
VPAVSAVEHLASRFRTDRVVGSLRKLSGGSALLVYLLIACIPPWIGWSLLVFGVVPQNSPLSGLLFLTGESASLAGLIATFLAEGGRGVSDLLRQAIRVKRPIQWWLYALVVPQISFIGAGVLYLLLHGKPVTFEASALLSLGTPALLVPFLFGPLGEEFGWRGFLLPRLMERFSVLPACLLGGTIWAFWHWPLFYQGIVKSPAQGIFFPLTFITGLSFLIAAVYLRTRSLLLAMLTHWSSNAVQSLIGKYLPGLPNDINNDLAFGWCLLGVLALFVASAIPLLLRSERVQSTASAKAAQTN